MRCFLNGERLATGVTSINIISSDIQMFREITFGFSTEAKTSESRFTGYVREFRWWRVVRSAF